MTADETKKMIEVHTKPETTTQATTILLKKKRQYSRNRKTGNEEWLRLSAQRPSRHKPLLDDTAEHSSVLRACLDIQAFTHHTGIALLQYESLGDEEYESVYHYHGR